MHKANTTITFTASLCSALLLAIGPAQAAITSDFDDGIYPGGPGGGWVDGWQNTIGTPVILTNSPMDSGTPYIRLDATGGTIRNFMRQFEDGGGVSPSVPYYIRWKFRLDDPDMVANFTSFNDRIHFFGRNGARLAASTDASINWSIMAAGTAHASGAVAGQTFWIFDNTDMTGGFTLGNHVDTGIALVSGHVYSFEVYVVPEDLNYTVSVLDETTSSNFVSSAPHAFRNLASPGESHTFLHFGIQTSASAEVRPFELDSVSITPWNGPVLQGLTPVSYAVHDAAEGIHFELISPIGIDTSAISLVLNSNDVTGQLVITGNSTNRIVDFTNLVNDTTYTMVIGASNAAGQISISNVFYTTTNAVVIYDSGGFSNDTVYPIGPLDTNLNDGTFFWTLTPNTSEPSEIVDLADGQFGKVLRRQQLGDDRIDYLNFSPVGSGVVELEFDARVSDATGRTLDMSLNSISRGGQGPFLMWGTNALNYFNGTEWVAQTNMDTAWHHIKTVNYVSGPKAGTFDLYVDGSLVNAGLLWRTTFSPVGSLRIGAIRGDIIQFGEIDNLVLRAAPEPLVAVPVTLLNPNFTGGNFSFSFDSLDGINYIPQFVNSVTDTNWTSMGTIAGDGTQKTVTDTNPPSPQRVYRVESQLP